MIGGLDPGLRVGGRCVHTLTSKKGYVMGTSMEGTSMTLKVQWDDGDSNSRYVDSKNTLLCVLQVRWLRKAL